MNVAAVSIGPHDVAWRVDPERNRPKNCSRHIDRGKRTIAEQKAMKIAAGLPVGESTGATARRHRTRISRSKVRRHLTHVLALA